ncbi:MAG TPA: pseudouridine synthase [Pirellulales bacterium]|nr:pseudouridine synthase [Pirellulales bacterium]
MRRRQSRAPRHQPSASQGQSLSRLQKILAAAGLGSRRQCEQIILEGRVEVDRKVVANLGAKADPFSQEVRVDGNALPKPKRVYYLVNKPPGVLSTNRDPAGRPRVVDLLAPRGERLFTVGRLDMSSEGLILATNDGELANLLTHPRYGVEKTYHVEVAGSIDRPELARLEAGMYLAEGFARVVGARIKTRFKKSTLLEITLDEGRNREIRRLLARTGHKVMRLRRIALGPLRLGEVPLGAYRPLTGAEVNALRQTTTPAAREEREKIHRAQAARKAVAAAQKTATESGATVDSATDEATKGNGAGSRPMRKRSERADRHDARHAGTNVATAAIADETEHFRLPRGPLGDGQAPQRGVIIGGDSSSLGPWRPKRPRRARKERPAQRFSAAQSDASQGVAGDSDSGDETAGSQPGERRAVERWRGPARQKSGTQPRGGGRAARAARGKATAGVKAGRRAKASNRGGHTAHAKKAGRIKRRGAGRGDAT